MDRTSSRLTSQGKHISSSWPKLTLLSYFDSLRAQIGIVPQTPILFDRSIMDNVRYANLSATDEEVYEACQAACIHDQILGFTDGKTHHLLQDPQLLMYVTQATTRELESVVSSFLVANCNVLPLFWLWVWMRWTTETDITDDRRPDEEVHALRLQVYTRISNSIPTPIMQSYIWRTKTQ